MLINSVTFILRYNIIIFDNNVNKRKTASETIKKKYLCVYKIVRENEH